MQLLTHAEAEGIFGEMLPQELRYCYYNTYDVIWLHAHYGYKLLKCTGSYRLHKPIDP